jgi:hypothetical protein
MTPDVVGQAQQLFEAGLSKPEVARQLDVPYETLRKAVDQGRVPLPDRLYVRSEGADGNGKAEDGPTLREAIRAWQTSSRELRQSMDALFETLKEADIG